MTWLPVDGRDLDDTGNRVEEAIRRGAERIVITGTDASVGAAVPALLGAGDRAPLVALAAVDTPSSLLRMFGHGGGTPRNYLESESEYRIDVMHVIGDFGERFVINCMGAGVAGRLPHDLRISGWARTVEVEVSNERRTVNQGASSVIVMNGQFWGTSNPTPRAILEDGVVEAQLIGGNLRRRRQLQRSLRRGVHVTDPMVGRLRGGSMEVSIPSHWMVAADGESLGHGSFSVRVIPAALRLKI